MAYLTLDNLTDFRTVEYPQFRAIETHFFILIIVGSY